jgi:hypothetical protein
MTTAISTVGLEYAATDLQPSDLSILFKVFRGLWESPSVRGTDTVIPAAEGRFEGNRVKDIQKIELRGWVRATPSVDSDIEDAIDSYQASFIALRELFANDRDRADLVATLRDGTLMSIAARPLNMVINEVIEGWFANVSIEMEGYGDWAEVVGS